MPGVREGVLRSRAMSLKLTIAQDFKGLCPALTEEEYRLLEESLTEEGCRDPIVVWKCGKQTIIVDGHHRYEICAKHNLSFKVRVLDLESRQEAMGWAVRNQLGRRNATEEQKSYLRGKLYKAAKLQVGRPPVVTKLAQSAPINAVEKLATETGVDRATLKRDEKYTDARDALAAKSEVLKDAASRGDIPKSAVKTLAGAPKSTLKKLEKLEGKELRKAVKEVAKPSEKKSDKPPKQYPRSHWFKQWEMSIGPLVRLVDKIAGAVGEKQTVHHDAVQAKLNDATVQMMKWMGVKK